jgi:hypothetical protein
MDKRVKRALFGFFTGTAIGCTVSAVFYLASARLRHRKAQRRYQRDIATVNQGNSCALCGGTATAQVLIEILGQPVWRCVDRQLCQTTAIYTAMLASTEDVE